MGKTDLRYTYVAKGKYWRFRHRLLGETSLPGVPGDEAFHARYAQLLAKVTAAKPELDRKSIAWLTARYRKSAEFRALADPTQLDYGKTLDLIDRELGEQPFRLTTRAMIKAVRDDHAATPRKAHKIKQMTSRLYSWAQEEDLVPAGFNPAAGITKLATKGGPREIVVWSDAEITRFLATCPEHVRTPVLIALYTGQRREDVARMTWQQFQGDIVRVRQSKTKALLDIPCHMVLRSHLEALRKAAKGVVICTTAEGRAFTPNGLSGALRPAVEATEGMAPNRSMHGLRYAAGSRMEEAGCTVAEIESVLGHQTFKMALKYASQRLRAKAAMAKMEAAHEG